MKPVNHIIAQAPFGLGRLLIDELRAARTIPVRTKVFLKRQRNHDFLMTKTQDFPTSPLRIAEMVWACPVFGRYKFTKSLLDQMAEQVQAYMQVRGLKNIRAVVQCTGKQFQRQDLLRFISREMTARGIQLTEDFEREAFWVITIDELFYFGLPQVDAPLWKAERGTRQEREASLPQEIAAAMVYLAGTKAGELVWDPVCGSGTLLAEVAAREPEALLFGSDIDRKAIEAAKINIPLANLSVGDSAKSSLQNIDLVIGNLPFGKRYGSKETNLELYRQILQAAIRVGASRAVLLTSDIEALRSALLSERAWRLTQAIDTQVKGLRASIFVLGKSMGNKLA